VFIVSLLIVSSSIQTSRMRSTRFLFRLFVFFALLALVVLGQEASEASSSTCGAANDQECANPEVVAKGAGDPKCPDRDHLMRCAAVHLDTNKNGKLDRSELQSAIDQLPWYVLDKKSVASGREECIIHYELSKLLFCFIFRYARGILQILGSVDKMMKKCDVDKDDAISIDYDMEHNKETCLATCFKRRAFKSAFFPECEL